MGKYNSTTPVILKETMDIHSERWVSTTKDYNTATFWMDIHSERWVSTTDNITYIHIKERNQLQ